MTLNSIRRWLSSKLLRLAEKLMPDWDSGPSTAGLMRVKPGEMLRPPSTGNTWLNLDPTSGLGKLWNNKADKRAFNPWCNCGLLNCPYNGQTRAAQTGVYWSNSTAGGGSTR